MEHFNLILAIVFYRIIFTILSDSVDNEEQVDTTMSSIESEAPTTQSINDVCSTMVGEYCLLDMEPGTSINGTATISQTDVKAIYYTFFLHVIIHK